MVSLKNFEIFSLVTIFDLFTLLDLDVTLSLRFSPHSHDSHAESDKNDYCASGELNFPDLFTENEDVA